MTVFWKQKWRDKFKVTWLLFLYFFLSSRRFQSVKRCVQTFREGWGRTWRRRFSMSETLVHVIHSRLRVYLNMWDDGFLRTNVLVDFKPKKTWERFRVFFNVFLGFLGLCANSIPCTLALNYFIILFLLFLFIYHGCQKSRNSHTGMKGKDFSSSRASTQRPGNSNNR